MTRYKLRKIVQVALAEQDSLAARCAPEPLNQPNWSADDYFDRAIAKPWGYEYLLFSSASAGVWILCIDAGQSTSMHCHLRKTTSLVVLDGDIFCATLSDTHERTVGEGIFFDKGVFHQSSVHSQTGAIVMEVESPPAKHDLLRLRDAYGRAGAGYEGRDKHMTIPSGITTLCSNEGNTRIQSREFGQSIVEIFSPLRGAGLARAACLDGSELVYLLEGGVSDASGACLLRPGGCALAQGLLDSGNRWEPSSLVAVVTVNARKCASATREATHEKRIPV